MKMRFPRFFLPFSLSIVILPAQAEFSLTSGFDYSTGKYGETETTNTLIVPVKLAYETAPWLFTLYIPYIDTEGVVNRDTASSIDSVESQSGLGDIVAGVFHEWRLSDSDFSFDLGLKTKLVTADSDNDLMTTGNPDYSVQARLYSQTSTSAFLVRLGWTLKGDIRLLDSTGTVTTYDPDNPLDFGVAYSFAVNDLNQLGLAYDWRQRLFSDSDDASEVSLLLSHRLASQTRLEGYLVRGLSDASPDWALGLFWVHSW